MEDDLLAGARDMPHEAPAVVLAPPSIAAPVRQPASALASIAHTALAAVSFVAGSEGIGGDRADVDESTRSAMPLLLEVVDRLLGTAGSA